MGSRIVSVIDAFDAMVSSRPYRRGLPVEEAERRLLAASGTQFDPIVIAKFLPLARAEMTAVFAATGTTVLELIRVRSTVQVSPGPPAFARQVDNCAGLTFNIGELRLGRPRKISERRLWRRSFFAEADLSVKYVYILQSEQDTKHFYTGITDDLGARLPKHNSGEVAHTAKYRPWHIKSYVAFTDDRQAFAFEKYLKSGSGRAFAKKHL